MKLRAVVGLACVATLLSTGAHAGVFGDSLAKCLVRSASESDRTLLIQWIFAAMSSHPDVHALSAVTEEKGKELNQKAALLYQELVAQRCKGETVEAVKNEGLGAITQGFSVLGQVAMQGILTNSAVATYLGGMDAYLDRKAIEAALK